jgi:hypothetical protein
MLHYLQGLPSIDMGCVWDNDKLVESMRWTLLLVCLVTMGLTGDGSQNSVISWNASCKSAEIDLHVDDKAFGVLLVESVGHWGPDNSVLDFMKKICETGGYFGHVDYEHGLCAIPELLDVVISEKIGSSTAKPELDVAVAVAAWLIVVDLQRAKESMLLDTTPSLVFPCRHRGFYTTEDLATILSFLEHVIDLGIRYRPD